MSLEAKVELLTLAVERLTETMLAFAPSRPQQIPASVEEVRAKAMELGKVGMALEVGRILANLGAQNIRELAPEKYAQFVADCNAALKGQ